MRIRHGAASGPNPAGPRHGRYHRGEILACAYGSASAGPVAVQLCSGFVKRKRPTDGGWALNGGDEATPRGLSRLQ